MEEELLWEAHEYEHRHKTADWYWGLGLIGLAAAVFSVFFGSILFAIVIALGTILLGLYAAREPKLFEFRITETGIAIGNTLYPYQTLDSFWVDEHHEEFGLLLVKSKKALMPIISIPIEGIDPRAVRDALSQKLPEEEHHESVAVHLMHWLGF